MKKKITVLLVILTMLSFVIAGCGGGENPVVGTWNLYLGADKTEVTITNNQISMLGTVTKYSISKDGTALVSQDDDGTERSVQFMVDGDHLSMAGNTLYRSGSDAEKEYLASVQNKILASESSDMFGFKPAPTEAPILETPPTDSHMTESTSESDGQIVFTDLKPSEGLEFESNGDGTCTLVGLGVCSDADIVIPEKSSSGDTITSIGEYAFMSLEDVNSVTLYNYSYEVGERAFLYSEIKTLNIIGGNPVINESAFSSCEDLTAIKFKDCAIKIDEYAFLSCGKDAVLTFVNCSGYIGARAFQYGDIVSLYISNCELEIDESAFSSCEELTSIAFEDSVIAIAEYAFLSCGDSASVEMIKCSVTMDDRAFEYSSLDTLKITGSKLEMGESVFSSCEDLTALIIDCESVSFGEYAFLSCEDLVSVSICDNGKSDNVVEIDDRVFQYCENLSSVVIGNGTVTVGKYVFSGCADNLAISVAGSRYTADSIENGIS